MPQPASSPAQPAPLPFWGRVLLPLLISLVGLLLGWQLGSLGHLRLREASQTSPLLPELRPLQNPAPSLQGALDDATPPVPVWLSRWTAAPPTAAQPAHRSGTDLITLGRMNLDGG
jgi:hypothetical protein